MRKLHNEELYNFYLSPNIIRQIKSTRMKWAGHMTRMGEERKCTRFWWESQKERDYSEDRGIDGGLRSEWISETLAGGGFVSGGSG
jgi:hypothetical protein